MRPRVLFQIAVLGLFSGACSEAPPVRPEPPVVRPRPRPVAPPEPPVVTQKEAPSAPPTAEPAVQTTHMTEKQYAAAVRAKVAERCKVDPDSLVLSPASASVAYVQVPPPPAAGARKPRKPTPRKYTLVVVDAEGGHRQVFRPVVARGADEPPRGLRFLGEDRLVYEVVQPPPPPAPKRKPRPKPKPKSKAIASAPAFVLPPVPPKQVFVIQPLLARARPVRCEGVRFGVAPGGAHLVYVRGLAAAQSVMVDGVTLYPRGRGRTAVVSDPVWSNDGQSLAFVEANAKDGVRLVLLPALDNPTGDTNWPLPPATALNGLQVFWAGADKLVVGKTVTQPLFATSFAVERPQ